MNSERISVRLNDARLSALDAACVRLKCDRSSVLNALIDQFAAKLKRVERTPRGPKKTVEPKGKAGRKG
jgi:metal-responsive CopG/Arc/MetJ family transcriptional regulator